MQPPSRLLRALVVGLAASAIAGGVAASGALQRAEHGTVDQRFDLRGSHATPDVAVVAIDAPSIARYRGWPFPRSLHARMIDALLADGARRVVYDVQFSEPAQARQDRALIRAAASPRVVLGTITLRPRTLAPVVIGAAQIRHGGGQIGLANLPADEDGVWRRLDARVNGVPALAVLGAGGSPNAPERPIDYAGPRGTVPTYSFAAVLAGRVPRSDLAGRIVVVGATDTALNDLHPTPTDPLMPGPEIHADAIQTILDGYPLRELAPFLVVLLVLAAGLLAPLATLAGSPSRAVAQALGVGALGALVLLGGAQLAFDAGTILPVIAPLLALVLGTAGAVALTYAVEVRARRRLRTTFERFVPPQVARELLPDDAETPRLESRELVATVLFCDLRGFTTLAERLAAEQVIAVLNRYLALVSGAVFAHGGTVVSYQGDGVLAVFGAPLPQPDHAARALAAAREVLDEALPRFNAWLLEERLAEAPLSAGIGLNTGPVMSGLVGSERRVEYAAVGDATNVAARLQALGRDADPPAHLFVSGTTVAALGEAAAGTGLRHHGEVDLRGRSEPVAVWVAD